MTEVLRAGGLRVGLLMLDQMFGFYCTAAVCRGGIRDCGKQTDGPNDGWMDSRGKENAVGLTSF